MKMEELAKRLHLSLEKLRGEKANEIREFMNISVPLCSFIHDGYCSLTKDGEHYVYELYDVMVREQLYSEDEVAVEWWKKNCG